MSIVPAHLVRTALALRGPAGEDWARRLPSLIAACARRWSLWVEPPFPGLSYNFAAPARRADGTAVVLKIGFPDREFLTEADALRLFAGRGAVEVLEADLDVGAMLLERIEPGTPLLALDDETATSAAVSVMRRLWQPVPASHRFPTVGD